VSGCVNANNIGSATSPWLYLRGGSGTRLIDDKEKGYNDVEVRIGAARAVEVRIGAARADTGTILPSCPHTLLGLGI
jgi:hypothetical protein